MDDKLMSSLLSDANWNIKNRTKVIALLSTEQCGVFLESFANQILFLEAQCQTKEGLSSSFQPELEQLVLQRSLLFITQEIPNLPNHLATRVLCQLNGKDLACLLKNIEKDRAVQLFSQLIANADIQSLAMSKVINESQDWCVVSDNSLGVVTDSESFINDSAKFNEFLQEFFEYDEHSSFMGFNVDFEFIFNALDDQSAYHLIKYADGQNKANLINAYLKKVLKSPLSVDKNQVENVAFIINEHKNEFIIDSICQLSAVQVISLIRVLPSEVTTQLFSQDYSARIINDLLIPALVHQDNVEVLNGLQEFAQNSEPNVVATFMLRSRSKHCHLITQLLVQTKQDELCDLMIKLVAAPSNQELVKKCKEHIPIPMIARLMGRQPTRLSLVDLSDSSYFDQHDINELCVCLENKCWARQFLSSPANKVISLFSKLEPEKKRMIGRWFQQNTWLKIAEKLNPKDLLDFTDLDKPQQLKYWHSRHKKPTEIAHIIETIPANKWPNLLLCFDAELLAGELCKMPIDVQVQFIQSVSTQPNVVQLLIQLYKLSEHSTSQLVSQLGYLSEQSTKELISLLQQVNTTKIKGRTTLEKKIVFILGELKLANFKASMIQSHFRRHLDKVKNNRLEMRPTYVPEGFRTLKNKNHKLNGQPIEYYFDKDRVFPPIRIPSKELSSQESQKVKGSFKRAKARDAHYIQFKAQEIVLTDKASKYTQRFISVKTSRNTHLKEKLKKIKNALQIESWTNCSIQPGLQGVVLEKGKITSVAGGQDITNFTQENGIVDYHVFERFCNEMARLHQHNIFFRDVKGENLLYKTTATSESGKSVRLDSPQLAIIDLDDLYTGEPGEEARICGSPAYITAELLKKSTGNLIILKARDEYATLITMLLTTAPETFDMKTTPRLHGTLEEMIFRYGILNAENTHRKTKEGIVTALKRMIKDEHFTTVKNFLANPVSHSLRIPLHDMIDWSK
ncbi:hypothetical protein [Parashewanella spongiae]|nr:hypothetical protein [Parashewanella spongiae]